MLTESELVVNDWRSNARAYICGSRRLAGSVAKAASKTACGRADQGEETAGGMERRRGSGEPRSVGEGGSETGLLMKFLIGRVENDELVVKDGFTIYHEVEP